MTHVDTVTRFWTEWQRLHARGAFAALADSELEAVALRLEHEAFLGDDLGIFLSVIATYGLAAPLLRVCGHGTALLRDGRSVIAVAITEPNAGSDARALSTELRAEGGNYRLTGSKWCITNAPVAAHVIVFCRDARTARLCAVLLPREREGIDFGPPLSTFGARSSPTGAITFRDVRVDADEVLGSIGDGERLMHLAFVRERALAAWPLLGVAGRVLQQALWFALHRSQFGVPIATQQHVQQRLVAAYEEYLSTRALAAESLLHPTELRVSMVKARAAHMAEHVFREAIAVLGSRGVQEATRLGEYLHDAVCASIAGGTAELHKRVVFDALQLDALRVRRGVASTAFPYPLSEAT